MSQSTKGADAAAAVREQIDAQLAKLRQLNEEQASTTAVTPELAQLQTLTTRLSELSVKKGGKITLKTPKGTRDWDPLSMALRKHVFTTIERVFATHGAVTIDTPVFELSLIHI